MNRVLFALCMMHGRSLLDPGVHVICGSDPVLNPYLLQVLCG